LVKKMKDLSSGELYKGLSGAPFFLNREQKPGRQQRHSKADNWTPDFQPTRKETQT
jgi:hypothetical protein